MGSNNTATREIDIKCHGGQWQSHNWYVLQALDDSLSVFYAPTLRVALLITRKLSNRICAGRDLPKSIVQRLSGQRSNAIFPTVERPKSFHLAIGLTNNCTLACDYCHAEADRRTNTTQQLIQRSIEHAFREAGKTPKKRMSVSFAVGGEPTMYWSDFVSTVGKIRALEEQQYGGVEKVYLSMTTNCYYGRKKREYIARHFDTLTLSIDGDEEIQNLHRPTRAFGGSYGLVAETVNYFIKSNAVKAGLRGTVSSVSVSRLPAIVDHFHRVFGSGYTVAFEPLIKIGRALVGTLTPPSNDEFARSYWEARKRGRDLGIRVITSAANIDRLVGRYCGAMAIPSFTVCTNGAITACHRDQDGSDYAYGKIDMTSHNIEVDLSKIEDNIAQTEMPTHCDACFAKWHCAGDCPDIRRIGYSRCDINRYLVYKQLQEALDSPSTADARATN